MSFLIIVRTVYALPIVVVGVWDMYQEIPQYSIANTLGWSQIMLAKKGAPHVWRFIREVAEIPNCSTTLVIYLAAIFAKASMPALSLW